MIHIAVLADAIVRDGDTTYGRASPLEASGLSELSANVVSIGGNYAELVASAEGGEEMLKKCTVLFAASGSGGILGEIIRNMSRLTWIQGMFAGLDHLRCEELIEAEKKGRIVLTNAKGVYSSSLAEWAMLGCAYFNKNVPRFLANKPKKKWERFTVGELRGKVMGIIGYGSIGEATARLAKTYGMKVIGCRKRPGLSSEDPYLDSIVGMEKLNDVMAESDFIVLAAALTPQTEGMIGRIQFANSKKGQVFINVGRGRLVDESALLAALGPDGSLLGAACDVFAIEPLPESSPLWNVPNILISCHNADITEGFQHQSVRLFVKNCQNFIAGDVEALENRVSAAEGY